MSNLPGGKKPLSNHSRNCHLLDVVENCGSPEVHKNEKCCCPSCTTCHFPRALPCKKTHQCPLPAQMVHLPQIYLMDQPQYNPSRTSARTLGPKLERIWRMQPSRPVRGRRSEDWPVILQKTAVDITKSGTAGHRVSSRTERLPQ